MKTVSEENLEQYRNEIKKELKEGKLQCKNEDLLDVASGFYVGLLEDVIAIFFLSIFWILYLYSLYNIKDNSFFDEFLVLTVIILLWSLFCGFVILRYFKKRKQK